MWGVIPAAGTGSRIQPLAFSKELLPVGSRMEKGRERPCAVSEYLIERMLLGGATKLCFVISPGKSDILEYYGGRIEGADVCYVVQARPAGLCDALFRARPLIQPDECVLVGLPDTIWYPSDGLARLKSEDTLSFLLFPVTHPELFDAVLTDENGNVQLIQVKQKDSGSQWVWGAFKLPGRVFLQLHDLWREREERDEYLGTLVNAYLDKGGKAKGVPAGKLYVDVGTVDGYRTALQATTAWAHEGQYNHDAASRIAHSKTNPEASSGTRLLVP
jgi:dTDP-glucose pyrophosphorylase